MIKRPYIGGNRAIVLQWGTRPSHKEGRGPFPHVRGGNVGVQIAISYWGWVESNSMNLLDRFFSPSALAGSISAFMVIP